LYSFFEFETLDEVQKPDNIKIRTNVKTLINLIEFKALTGAGMAYSVQRLAIGWTDGCSNTGGARDFFLSLSVQTSYGAHSSSCTLRTGLFPRG